MMNPTVEFIKSFIQNLIDDRDFRKTYFLGEGSSREAYRINKDLVLKLPRFFDEPAKERPSAFYYGLCQSNVEIDVWEDASDKVRAILNPIVLYGVHGDIVWEVQPMVSVAEHISSTYTVVDFAEEQGAEFIAEREYDEILDELIKCHKLQDGDLYDNRGNYGLNAHNKVVIIDYGFLGWDSIYSYVRENYGKDALDRDEDDYYGSCYSEYDESY